MRELRGDRAMRAEIREERLRATSGLRKPQQLDQLTTWRGRSGRRYVVGVHPVAEAADVADGVLIAVKRGGDGTASLLEVATPATDTSRGSRLRWISRMRARGATEVHVHLLAEDEAERDAVRRDLEAA